LGERKLSRFLRNASRAPQGGLSILAGVFGRVGEKMKKRT
jgi:hypothetical protein